MGDNTCCYLAIPTGSATHNRLTGLPRKMEISDEEMEYLAEEAKNLSEEEVLSLHTQLGLWGAGFEVVSDEGLVRFYSELDACHMHCYLPQITGLTKREGEGKVFSHVLSWEGKDGKAFTANITGTFGNWLKNHEGLWKK